MDIFWDAKNHQTKLGFGNSVPDRFEKFCHWANIKKRRNEDGKRLSR